MGGKSKVRAWWLPSVTMAQAKVDPSEALYTLLQQDSPKLSVVVVKIFTNSPYLPQGSFGFPYLDMTTLTADMLGAQFSLAQLHLCRLLPFSSTQVVLPCEKDNEELKVHPFLLEGLWESSEDHHLSDPVPAVSSSLFLISSSRKELTDWVGA